MFEVCSAIVNVFIVPFNLVEHQNRRVFVTPKNDPFTQYLLINPFHWRSLQIIPSIQSENAKKIPDYRSCLRHDCERSRIMNPQYPTALINSYIVIRNNNSGWGKIKGFHFQWKAFIVDTTEASTLWKSMIDSCPIIHNPLLPYLVSRSFFGGLCSSRKSPRAEQTADRWQLPSPWMADIRLSAGPR